MHACMRRGPTIDLAWLPNLQAAVEEGIVTGGGCTLLRLSGMVDGFKATLTDDEQKVRGGVEGGRFWGRLLWGAVLRAGRRRAWPPAAHS